MPQPPYQETMITEAKKALTDIGFIEIGDFLSKGGESIRIDPHDTLPDIIKRIIICVRNQKVTEIYRVLDIMYNREI